ncbi:MAG: hypothetical protein KF847_19065 [Pirellulales bacterium]|nr:hypothetical protein [Pirellulales bacterium]
MGGLGSGNHLWRRRKATVEESLWLSMLEIRDRLADGAAGSLAWKWNDGRQSSIGYRVASYGGAWIVTLHYRCGDSEDVEIPVRLQSTPTQFGGPRWWFTCPLIVNGVACQRRVGKLYLPPGAKYFGCRSCHRLSYRSSQEAHQAERLAASLARQLDCDRDVAELLADRWRGGG